MMSLFRLSCIKVSLLAETKYNSLKMRIVIISNYRIGSESGVANVSENLCKALSKKYQVLYICLGDKYKYSKSSGLTYLTIPSSPIRQGYIPKITPRTIEKLNQSIDDFSPDIIHAQNIVFVSVLALIWARKNNVPYITTFHSLPTEGVIWLYPKFKNEKIISTLDYKLTTGYVRRFLENANLVIALNKAVKKSVLRVNKKVPVAVVNNGLDITPFNKLRIKTQTNKVIFTYLGSYMEKKNQEYLIKVFSHLPSNHILELYGDLSSGEKYVKKLKRLIVKNKIKNVKIGKFLNRKGVLKQLEKTDYFVSASLKEAQSLVVVESLASGTPVIGLENETTTEIINNKNGLLLPKSTSPENFAEKLTTYINKNKSTYKKTALFCRKSVERFDIDTVTKELEKIYQNLINTKRNSDIKDKNQYLHLIPEKYRELFTKVAPNINKPTTVKLKIVLFFSVLLSILVWPLLKFFNYFKNKLLSIEK